MKSKWDRFFTAREWSYQYRKKPYGVDRNQTLQCKLSVLQNHLYDAEINRDVSVRMRLCQGVCM